MDTLLQSNFLWVETLKNLFTVCTLTFFSTKETPFFILPGEYALLHGNFCDIFDNFARQSASIFTIYHLFTTSCWCFHTKRLAFWNKELFKNETKISCRKRWKQKISSKVWCVVLSDFFQSIYHPAELGYQTYQPITFQTIQQVIKARVVKIVLFTIIS